MTAPAIDKIYTPDDLLKHPDSKSFELANGQYIERKSGALPSSVGGTIAYLLLSLGGAKRTGWVFGASCGYHCFPYDVNRVRKPKVSYLSKSRLESPPQGWITLPPELVVEVPSYRDLVYDMDARVEDYRSVGVSLIWVVNPELRIVYVHKKDGTITQLRESDKITGGNVLPGFSCIVADFFDKN